MYVAMCVCVCLHELIKTWPIDMVLKDVGEIYVTVMDVRTFGIEGDCYENQQQQTSVCEQICSSAGVAEVCTANRPTLIQPFICNVGVVL